MNDLNLSVLRRTAADIAAAAVFELFPDIEIWGGRETAAGFSCDFYFPHSLNPEIIFMIEERIRQIVREKRPIRTLEMMAFSAGELLKSQGHARRAEEIEESEGLVEVVQIGSFYNLSRGPHLKNTAELGAFKLLALEPLEGKGIRLTGVASYSKQELKDFLKKWEVYSSQNHMRLGEDAGLWMRLESEVVWQGCGLRLKNQVIEFLKKRLFADAFEVSGPQNLEGDRSSFHLRLAKKKGQVPLRLAEIWTCLREDWEEDAGLFQCHQECFVQISSFCRPEMLQEELISSLQSIGKTLNILGFNYCLKLVGRKKGEKAFLELQGALKKLEKSGEKLSCSAQIEMQNEMEKAQPPSIDFLIEDGLNRAWPAVRVKPILTKEPAMSAFFVAASVEKIIALLIERYLSKMNCEELIDMMVQL